MIDPLANPPSAVLRYLSEMTRYDENGRRYFADADNTAILDLHAEGCPNAGPRAAARWLQTSRPDLWAETKATEKPVETAPPSTAADVMAAVRSGSMTADEATRRLMVTRPAETRQAPGIPEAPAFAGDSMTALMAKAKSGDKSAIAAITAKYLNPNR